MKLLINSEILRNSINRLLSVVDKKNTRPILGYILFDIKNDYLELTATDLEVSAKLKLKTQINGTGTFCVNAKNLFDILRELPNADVNIEIVASENNLKLTCNFIEYSLVIASPDDFPKIEFNFNPTSFIIEPAKISELIDKTSHAISLDETRIYLNGIYFQEVNSKLRAVATDGHRLSMYETELVDVKKMDTLTTGIIIPKKGVFELKKMAENANGPIKVSLDESFLILSSDNDYFLSVRLIAREYPKYQAVIPSKTSFKLVADKTSLFNAVKRIKIMSNEKSNGVRIKLSAKELILSANHPSLGNALEKIDVDYNGKDMTIGFNAKYLLDTLSSLDEGEVSFELNNELSPVIIKSGNHPNYLGIIMPLKL